MIQYFDDYDLACVDGYSFRRDKKTGYYLSSKPINGRRVRLHVYMWEKENGKTPKGYHIHHADHDKRNNELSNLVLITSREHTKLHGAEMTEEHREKLRKTLVEKARPKASEWHKSEAGREWHKQHGKETWVDRKPNTYICTQCGTKFETLKVYHEGANTFCSNKCKAAFRRDSGVDDVDVVCAYCGRVFRANKYQKNKYCKDCVNNRVWRRKRV